MLNKKILHGELISRRAFIIGLGKLWFLSLLGIRMFYLQLIKSEEYRTLSDKNRINFVVLPPIRGKIYDLDGNILATNKPCYQLVIDKSINNNYRDELEIISNILNFSPDKYNYIKQKIKKSSRHTILTILDHLDWEQVSMIEEQKHKLAAIFIDVGYLRFYPFSSTTSHLIGYLGQINEQEKQELNIRSLSDFNIGKSGIEKYYDNKLRGEFGYKKVEVNAYGKQVRTISETPTQSGADMHLNIDASLQKKIQQYLNPKGSSAIVMDIRTGNVLICVSTPGFESNNFSKLSENYWQSLISDPHKPLINKVIQNSYPPGSVFKIITVLAALEVGINPNKTVFCDGSSILGTNSFRCWNHRGHGTLDMMSALKYSCNIYMYELARIVGPDKILAVAREFGFGSKTGIDISPESSGFVPSKEWKKKKLKLPWSIGDSFNLAIGQGFLGVTPIQLARFITAIASNGKLYTPRILKNASEFYNVNIKTENIKIIQESLYNTVNVAGGTAYYNRIFAENRKLAGKTGTAQVQSKLNAKDDLNRDSIAWARRNHALFLGFAPYSDPRYSVTVFVDHGGGGSIAAAPVARKIMSDVLDKYMR
ncbi:penicillin-binding protein 2 [Rickettsia typhi]|uniref:Cell division protein FtsI/ penicillin-binding protein n=2 Tax=Rickettsia typhi TaxID=785 RepID=Q68WH1_RICTY|nr:penicillin-binding protein 2 [Rickettsia typhi]AAU04021.1 cell division protein FtsI/ penicillin-binding protein [Rickettsia typhi str. Wilmington]AFE54399.1 penicillin-binding protein [Rickettsia typhi str. TH1527]AFE55237.1 penicillin-binding protein [Rickettsia typhi str. B9991CWPP]